MNKFQKVINHIKMHGTVIAIVDYVGKCFVEMKIYMRHSTLVAMKK